MIRRMLVLVVAVLVVSAGSAATASGSGGHDGSALHALGRSAADERGAAVQRIFTYDRPATFGVHLQADVLVEMRDGFALTCDVRRPAAPDGSPAPGRYPGLVLNYTGYGRTQPRGDSSYFTQRGYNVVICNVRGSQGGNGGNVSPAPGSVGLADPFSPQEQEDNYDLIEWLAARPWSSGRIGQEGGSYGGITTMLVAGRQVPPSLKAVIPRWR